MSGVSEDVGSPPDLRLVDVRDMIDEIARRFGSSILITNRSIDGDNAVLGIWPSEECSEVKVIGMLELSKKWNMEDSEAIIHHDEMPGEN